MNIQWHNERRKVSELSDHPNNPRLQTERGMAALKKSIERSGYADVICINTDGTILSGHARKKQLLELGFGEIDVRVPDRALDEQEQRYYMVEANKAIAGEFDFEILANVFEVEELREVGFTDFDLGIQVKGNPEGKLYDETIAEGVELCKCERCGHQHARRG